MCWAAQELSLPIAIDGVADGPEPDFYKIVAKAGQRVAIDIFAARIGSACDPWVRVLDAQGRELLVADDDDASGGYCRLAFTAPQDATYFLELRDNKYQSGVRYRLRAADFPIGSVAYPLAIRKGTTDTITFPAREGTADNVLLRSAGLPLGTRDVSLKLTGGIASSFATTLITELPEFREVEGNDAAEQATHVSIPGGMNGMLATEHDRDFFEFVAGQGDKLEFVARARSLGSPAYPVIRLYDSKGTQLAESPVNENDEFSLSFAIPADGTYRIGVEDLLQRGGANYAYRIGIDRAPFALL